MKVHSRKVLAVLLSVALLIAGLPLVLASADGSFAYQVHSGGIAVYTYYSGAVSSVQFPTWTSYNGQDDLIWYNGSSGSWTVDGVFYNYAVWFPLSDHNNEGGTYITHVYVNGASVAGGSYEVNTSPSILRATTVQNGTDGYYAYAYVSDNGTFGIARVQFPTWTNYNDQDDIQPDWWSNSAASGTAGSWTVDGQSYNYQYYVSFAAHNGETGSYNTHIYAYNTIGNQGTGGVSFSPNFNTPSITKAIAVQNGTGGFWIYANAATNGGYDIQKVQYPTWTNYNGQDDLAGDWTNNSSITGTPGTWTIDGYTYNTRFYVDVAAHNNEYGTYITDIYPYNKAGLTAGGYRLVYIASFGVSVNPNGGTWSGGTAAQTLSGEVGAVKDIADPTPPTGYHFTSWTKGGAGTWNASAKQFTIGVGDGSLKANYAINTYTVMFKNGYTNETLKTEPVNHGSAATAPTPAAYIAVDGAKHMKFTGWDKAFNNITGATVVTAQYAEQAHDAWSAYTDNGETHSRTCEHCGYVETEEHGYAFDSFVWSADGTTAQAKLVCDKDATHIKYVDAQMSFVHHDATCEDDEYTVYTAAYGGQSEDNTATVENTATGHDYALTGWAWNGDHTAATASFTCGNDGTHVETVTDEEIEIIPVSSQGCETDEVVKYKAVVTFEDVDYTEITDEIKLADRTGHAYALTGWAWNSDHTAATATFTCGNDGTHVETVTDSEIEIIPVSAQGCETDEVVKYKAVVTFEDVDYTEITDEIKLANRTGHAYALTGWAWNDDHTKATATFTCGNDAAHVETVTDDEIEIIPVSSQGCETDEVVKYKAAVTFEDAEYTETTDEITFAGRTGHAYALTGWEWNGDHSKATATFTCGNDPEHVETVTDEEIDVETVSEQTCVAAQIETYTASVEFEGETYTEKVENFTVAEPTRIHTPVKTEAKAATCTEKGNIEYYTCSVCGLIFTEEACENLITAEDTVLDFDYTNHSTTETVTKNAKAATCNEDGYTGDICCKDCGRLIEEGTVIPSAGAEHVFGEWYVKTAAGCTEDGVEERACENCGETETRPVPALGHDWGEWTDDAEDAPSCTKDGRQNRVCARCGETETREITASEKGHTIRVPNEENEGYCASCGKYRCLFCEKDEHMHETDDSSIMTFFIHVVHYFYHLFSNFRYTLSHR